MATRPTADRVKEALFSIIQFDLPGAVVLDLFGGTGQLGIEAASRGAGKVVIVEAQRDAVKLIRENVKNCQVDCQVVQSDAIGFLQRGEKYDLILMDHMMPEPDGIQTLHMLRENKDNVNCDTKVIVLTANAIEGMREEYLKEGFEDYLSKPVEVLRLEEMLEKYLPVEKQ